MNNKNVISRMRIINSCFTDYHKRYWTVADLLDKIAKHDINVTRRTIELDLMRMRYDEGLSYFAPIAYCRINKGHYYTNESYSIPHAINTSDMQNLVKLVMTLNDHWSKYINDSKRTIDRQLNDTEHAIEMLVAQVSEVIHKMNMTLAIEKR
jgi:hypothetical protein